jgi:phosphoribosylanthranilate isomerase
MAGPLKIHTPMVKVCCIQTAGEAALAVGCGAGALGFVGPMPSGPGVLSEEDNMMLAPMMPEGVGSFLLTSATEDEVIIGQWKRSGAWVVPVTGRDVLPYARAASRIADWLLLDSGNPDLPVKELGGTGRVHDWAISREIREEAYSPVLLAGGLNPGNIAEAVRTVRPYGVDVCSGVRTGGRLDEAKLRAFIQAIESECQEWV